MKFNYYSVIVTILLTIFISSCSKNEDKLLTDEKFASVLADLMIVEKLGVNESDLAQLTHRVFIKQNIDTSIFNRTRRFHQADEKYWIKIFGMVEKIINMKIDSIDAREVKPGLKHAVKDSSY